MGFRDRSRPRRRKARASATPLICALAAATLGMVGVGYQLIAPDGGVATAEQTAADPGTDRADAPAGGQRKATRPARLHGVRREPVHLPRAYPGSTADVPGPAVAAYQRAQTVINEVAGCGLDWTLLAAIGRVESNHGRGLDGGHRVTAKGRVRPAIVGALLDGTGKRGDLPDSDYGELDGDRQWDAPIGPMSLLPVTWTAVAVDADGDGRRDPQDLDDAALAAAVVLCTDAAGRGSGAEDAGDGSTPSENDDRRWRAALRAYHNGPRFVRTVLLLRERYAEHGTPQPEESPEPVPVPDELPSDEPTDEGPRDGGKKKDPKKPDEPRSPKDSPSAPPSSDDPASPSDPSTPSEPTSPSEPSDPPTSPEPSSPPTKSSAPPTSGKPDGTRRSSRSSDPSTP